MSQNSNIPFSVVEFYGEHNDYSCGYCKQSKSCQSHGMWAHKLSCQDYQDLIDRGWRRSGCYCYKPMMDITCCPAYTIKCDAMNFRLNKSHKKIIKRVNKFLRDGTKEPCEKVYSFNDGSSYAHEHNEVPSAQPTQLGPEILGMLSNANNMEQMPSSSPDEKAESSGSQAPRSSSVAKAVTNAPVHSSDSNLSSLPKKAKLMRIERKREKLQKKGLSGGEVAQVMQASIRKCEEKTLEDFLSDAPQESDMPVHRLKVKHVVASDGATAVTFNLYRSYQQSVHKDPPSKLSMERFKRFLVMSPLQIVTLLTSRAKFQESLPISYALYTKYQTAIHNDPPGAIEDYLDFLVKSPLKNTEGFGSFHQQYWLDDRLIAVGVIDVLPYCVSSVYFFYDPEFKFLSLGTYGSLRELAFTRALSNQFPSVRNYYMGFYIHSCPKMRYKSNLQPSYLLCPEAYTWHQMDQTVLAKLDARKYSRLNDDANAQDVNTATEQDLKDVVLVYGRYMTYSQYLGKLDRKPALVKLKPSTSLMNFGACVTKKFNPQKLL
uniref:Arginyl-tRNA--protein transferase 1 n=1 Tax=Anopheles dirus TaxID=7168 RepID=A0A182NPZ6_9DIPT